MSDTPLRREAIVGSLLGTAVGDAIGLPYEGMSRRRGVRVLGAPDRHRFLLGRGMTSDDTEHTCMVAQALIASGGEEQAFARSLAWGLRWWFLGLPAGIGLATLRASLKLWLGFPPSRSGVFSAGNGPAMRSAILGAAVDDPARLRALVVASTRLTHTDPKAADGALVVAWAARCARKDLDGRAFLHELHGLKINRELLALIENAVHSTESTPAFAASVGQGRGVSGYVNHTVPVAIRAWLRNRGDYRRAIMEVIECGGDTDTVAAIAGGIVGAGVGRAGIPEDWLGGLADWPRTVPWMEHLALKLDEMAEGRVARPPRLLAPALLARNAVFMAIVLLHGFRRTLPPY